MYAFSFRIGCVSLAPKPDLPALQAAMCYVVTVDSNHLVIFGPNVGLELPQPKLLSLGDKLFLYIGLTSYSRHTTSSDGFPYHMPLTQKRRL
jgi:hypothetical protein